jgi:GxxExxY protein
VRTNCSELTKRIIGCAIEVHRALGPGLLEAAYHAALSIEFDSVGLPFKSQVRVPATYKNHSIGEYRIDFMVENAVIVEVKSVARFDPVFESQMLTYLRVTHLSLGLLINFHSRLVTEGIRRFVL